jgi:predicted DCC family thiol-disulfide oxidoreductase YuxK
MFKKREQPMETLTVLYDASCGFCLSCRRWLESQPAYVPLQFVPSRTPAAARLLPDPAGPTEADELVVVSDEGYVYRGASAWIMCLWALVDFREWALRLSAPTLLPFARQAFKLLSQNRKSISHKLGLTPETELAETLRGAPAPACSKPAVSPSS